MIQFNPARARGFTLMEMAVVLVIIAILIGGVTVGRDVYRSAVAERIGSQFIQGWMLAYDRYVAQGGTVPGDAPGNPTGRVTATGTSNALCDNDLRGAMIKSGITLPEGRAEGLETHYVYQDSAGLPQDLEICFMTVGDWAEPSDGNGNYKTHPRNVMRLTGLTPELAQQLDLRIDGQVDARFGLVREHLQQNLTSNVSYPAPAYPWSKSDTDRYGSNSRDGQVRTLTAYVKMSR